MIIAPLMRLELVHARIAFAAEIAEEGFSRFAGGFGLKHKGFRKWLFFPYIRGGGGVLFFFFFF